MRKQSSHNANVGPIVHRHKQETTLMVYNKEKLKAVFKELLELINQTRKSIGLEPYTADDEIIFLHELYYAAKQHKGRGRKIDDKTPYIDHLLGTVYNMVREEHLTSPLSLLSGLKHDDIEDLPTVQKDPSKLFAPLTYRHLLHQPVSEVRILQERVRRIVEGVTKIKRAQGDKMGENEQTFARLLSTIRDHGPRVGYVKLADRSDNSDTFSALPPDKQKEKARETALVYAPLARLFKLKQVEEHLMQGSLACLNPQLREQYNQLIFKKIDLFLRQYKPLLIDLFCRKDSSLSMDEIEKFIFVPRGIAQAIRDANTSIPLESLRLEDLAIDDLDSCIEMVVLVKKQEDIPILMGRVVERLYSPHKASVHLKMDDLKDEGSLFRIFRTDLGGRMRIRINDSVSEAKTNRGILANLTDDSTPLGLREAIDQILLTAGETRKGIFDIAVEELLQPHMVVTTMKGKELELPTNATALDFAAKIHEDILIGAQKVIVADDLWNTNRRFHSLFDPLPKGSTVFIDSCMIKKKKLLPETAKIQLDPGWILFCQAPTKKILTSRLRPEREIQGEKFVKTICALFDLKPADIFDMIRNHQLLSTKKMNQTTMLNEIGEGKKNIIDLLSKSSTFASCKTWMIELVLPHQPGELQEILKKLGKLCNIEEVLQKNDTSLQSEKQRRVQLKLNFSPAEIPEYKHITTYHILKTFLKLHYEGYDIKAKPLPPSHHTASPGTNSIK